MESGLINSSTQWLSASASLALRSYFLQRQIFCISVAAVGEFFLLLDLTLLPRHLIILHSERIWNNKFISLGGGFGLIGVEGGAPGH